MDTRQLEPDVLCVFLPPEPQLRPELALLRDRTSHGENTHLVLDLSRVEIITSPSIGNLLLLQKLLTQRDRTLILCGTRLATRCIFRVAGLDSHFHFAENKSEALKMLRQLQTSAAEAPSMGSPP